MVLQADEIKNSRIIYAHFLYALFYTHIFLSDKKKETPWLTDAILCQWSLCFLVSPCYLQDAMPCQRSSSDLPWVLWIWESTFYSQAFFTLHSFLLFSRLPRGQQFNLKVSKASCWSWKWPQPNYLSESQQSTIEVWW